MCTYYIIESDNVVASKIKNIFDEFPEFKYLGTSSSVVESQNIIYKEYPKLIIVDFDNPQDIFNYISEIKQYIDEPPEFIALSTSTDMAYKAIKNDFFDYLIKPLSELDIRKAALHFKKKCSKSLIRKNICLKSYKDYHYINTKEIVLLKADNNTTDFHLSDGTIVTAYKTLKTFESILPFNFVRIHKSYIVNSDYIYRVNYGKNICTLKEISVKVPFTKTYATNIDTIIKSLSDSSLVSLN